MYCDAAFVVRLRPRPSTVRPLRRQSRCCDRVERQRQTAGSETRAPRGQIGGQLAGGAGEVVAQRARHDRASAGSATSRRCAAVCAGADAGAPDERGIAREREAAAGRPRDRHRQVQQSGRVGLGGHRVDVLARSPVRRPARLPPIRPAARRSRADLRPASGSMPGPMKLASARALACGSARVPRSDSGARTATA